MASIQAFSSSLPRLLFLASFSCDQTSQKWYVDSKGWISRGVSKGDHQRQVEEEEEEEDNLMEKKTHRSFQGVDIT